MTRTHTYTVKYDSMGGLDNHQCLQLTALLQVSIMASLRHPNVVMFMGLCLEPPCIVTQFCARGSLFDVLRKARTSPPFAQQLDWPKRLGMALDASKVTQTAHVMFVHLATLCWWIYASVSFMCVHGACACVHDMLGIKTNAYHLLL